MARELGAKQDQSEVRNRFLHHFTELFGYRDVKEADLPKDGGSKMEDGYSRSSIINPRPEAY
jgi:hypothetical protein